MTGLRKYKQTSQTLVASTYCFCFLPTVFSFQARGTVIGGSHGLFKLDSGAQPTGAVNSTPGQGLFRYMGNDQTEAQR